MNNEYRTAEQGISNVEENKYFIILHSLFDIRYWTPCKKYQKQLSAHGADTGTILYPVNLVRQQYQQQKILHLQQAVGLFCFPLISCMPQLQGHSFLLL